jgi:hypothetical protein
MKAFFLLILLVPCSLSLLAQAPATPPAAPEAHTSALGFSYSLPTGWQVEEAPAPPTLAGVKQQAQQNASSDDEKKGVTCVQVAFTGRHGDPASVVVVVQLPFDCLGQSATEKDLPGFAEGASEGIKQSFDIADPVYGSYTLGSHSFWIERAKGTPKGHPEAPYTVEIACSLLKKGAVCWMAIAADDAGLSVFERGAVVLEGESPAALVPANAFEKKPSP